MAIIYRHLKPCGEVFYIGIGNKKSRAYKKTERSEYWSSIVTKYPNYEVQIISFNITREEACELEKMLISWYGRRDLGTGTLVNLTDGGDGNYKRSEVTIKKLSNSANKLKGNNHFNFGKIRTDETKEKLSKAKKGIKVKQDVIDKIVNTRITKNKLLKKYICINTLDTWGTIKDCAETIGIMPATLQSYLAKSYGSKNPTSIMLYEDYIKGEKLKPFIKNEWYVEIIDTRTGKEVTKEQASAEIGFGIPYLYQMLSGSSANKTYFVLKSNYTGIIHEPKAKKIYGFEVINTESKDIFESMNKVADSIGMTRSTFQKRMKGKVKNDTPFMLLKDYEEQYGKIINY